jgi:hypothetical protein
MGEVRLANGIVLGKRYRVQMENRQKPEPSEALVGSSICLHYSFKPDSISQVPTVRLYVDESHDTATVSALTMNNDLKIFNGTVDRDTKECVLKFNNGDFSLQQLTFAVKNAKHVRDEAFVGEEASRLNLHAYMKDLTRKKKQAKKSTPVITVMETGPSVASPSETPLATATTPQTT